MSFSGDLKFFKKILLLFFVLVSCSTRKTPKDFSSGEHSCGYCQMKISDMRFRTQAISKKGKVHYFDSVECLTAWHEDHKKVAGFLWVGDFFKKDQWIDYSNAYFLQSSKLNSPMGAGLSSYESLEGAKKSQKIYGGKILDKKQLKSHVSGWKKKFIDK